MVASILVLTSTALTILAWKNGFWGIAGRVHYTLVVLALLSFILVAEQLEPAGLQVLVQPIFLP
jgi:hypothetical protein